MVEGATPLVEWLPFGAHRIEARKKGYVEVGEGLLVQPKMVAEIDLVLPEAPGPAAPALAAAAAAPEPVVAPGAETAGPPPQREAAGSDGLHWLPLATLGLGAALLAGGGPGPLRRGDGRLPSVSPRGRRRPARPGR